MSASESDLDVHVFADMLRIVEDHWRWKQVRAWLAEHAPFSPAHRTVEHFAECCAHTAHLLSVLTDSECGPKPMCNLLEAIVRGISGDDGTEEAVADVLRWRNPKPFDVLDEYETIVDIPPRCTAIQGHNRCVNIRHDDSVAHDFVDENPLLLMRIRKAQEQNAKAP